MIVIIPKNGIVPIGEINFSKLLNEDYQIEPNKTVV